MKEQPTSSPGARRFGAKAFFGLILILLMISLAVAACDSSEETDKSNDDHLPDNSSDVHLPPGGDEHADQEPDADEEPDADDHHDSGEDSISEWEQWQEQARMLDVSEKIGQMVMVGIEGKEYNEQARTLIEQHRIGGIITFGRNVSDAAQTLQLLHDLKEANARSNPFPLLLGIDEEGGSVTRMPPELIKAPAARAVGQKGDAKLAHELGHITALTLRQFGWNINFAPVLDVDSNPQNPVIGERSYGDHADTVIEIGTSVMKGLKTGGVIPVVKHFPGHGDTYVDSHLELPVISHGQERLEQVELLPFTKAIQEGADAVMVGHLLVPALDENEPATFSPTIIQGLLREQLEFDGVVITDDLTMGAVTHHYSVGEAAVKAVLAGADIVMIAHHFEQQTEAIRALKAAVERGDITEERLNESVARILRLKHQYGLTDELAVSEAQAVVENVNERMKDWYDRFE
jgi:beta-N-acetylhexosaminidase